MKIGVYTFNANEEPKDLKKENKKLKDLLKECKGKLKYCTRETYELETKIDEVLK